MFALYSTHQIPHKIFTLLFNLPKIKFIIRNILYGDIKVILFQQFKFRNIQRKKAFSLTWLITVAVYILSIILFLKRFNFELSYHKLFRCGEL